MSIMCLYDFQSNGFGGLHSMNAFIVNSFHTSD